MQITVELEAGENMPLLVPGRDQVPTPLYLLRIVLEEHVGGAI
jgi:hypothetical protein